VAASRKTLSSYLVHPLILALLIIAALLANYWDKKLVAAYLSFVFLFSLLAALWSRQSLNKLSVGLETSQQELFAGQEITLQYEIKNDKLLPLIWLEIWQPLPPRLMLQPVGEFQTVYDGPEGEGRQFYQKKLAFIKWYSQNVFATRWQALRRGVYTLKELTLRSGDGFGLAVKNKRVGLDKPISIVVYPRLVPVNTDIFFRPLLADGWGHRGLLEDTSILKGLRDYKPADSWKRINWRLLAKNNVLQVNEYEYVAPRVVHFIIDLHSFYTGDGLLCEKMLELIASVMVDLHSRGLRCGVSLPSFGGEAPVNLFASSEAVSITDVLYHLALAESSIPGGVFDEEEILRFADEGSSIYYVTADMRQAVTCSLWRLLEQNNITVLYGGSDDAGNIFTSCRLWPLELLRGED